MRRFCYDSKFCPTEVKGLIHAHEQVAGTEPWPLLLQPGASAPASELCPPDPYTISL